MLTPGTPRYGLDGEPAGTVTEEQVQLLMTSRAKHGQRLQRRYIEQERQRDKLP